MDSEKVCTVGCVVYQVEPGTLTHSQLNMRHIFNANGKTSIIAYEEGLQGNLNAVFQILQQESCPRARSTLRRMAAHLSCPHNDSVPTIVVAFSGNQLDRLFNSSMSLEDVVPNLNQQQGLITLEATRCCCDWPPDAWSGRCIRIMRLL